MELKYQHFPIVRNLTAAFVHSQFVHCQFPSFEGKSHFMIPFNFFWTFVFHFQFVAVAFSIENEYGKREPRRKWQKYFRFQRFIAFSWTMVDSSDRKSKLDKQIPKRNRWKQNSLGHTSLESKDGTDILLVWARVFHVSINWVSFSSQRNDIRKCHFRKCHEVEACLVKVTSKTIRYWCWTWKRSNGSQKWHRKETLSS